MEIREYMQLLRRWWWLLLLGALVAGAGAYFFSSSQDPVYRASATLLVSEGDVAALTDMSGLQTSERLAQSYVERLRNYEVLQSAISDLNLDLSPDALRDSMQVRLIGNTQLIELSVEHTDPGVARDLANQIPLVFAERNSAQQLERFASTKTNLEFELEELRTELRAAEDALADANDADNVDPALVEQRRETVTRLRESHSQLLQSYEDVRVAEARALNNILIDEAARLPRNPVRPQVLQNTILAAAAGLLAAAGIAFFLEYLDNTVKTPHDVERLIALPALGAIARMDISAPEDALVVARSPRAPVSEAYRHLRTNLMYSLVSRDLHSILVTSPNPGEGKTITAANLAVALVQAGKNVILVDTDLRRPRLHRLFNVSNRKGLSNLVLDPDGGTHYLQPTSVEGLRLLTSGPLPPNPAELLGSERIARLAKWLAKQADYVIYDSPPALAVTDAAVLSRLADITLLVVKTGDTTEQALSLAADQLRAVEGDLAGVVLNHLTQRDGGYAYYYYYQDRKYGYSENGHEPLAETASTELTRHE